MLCSAALYFSPSAKNPTDKPIIGISSYNLTPFQAAYYFNKIQCFCFEEQILDPGRPSERCAVEIVGFRVEEVL